MERKKLANRLLKLWFTEKEAELYLTLLEIGESTVLKISKSCTIKRATLYNVLDSLENKGLVRMSLEWSKSSFIAESPEQLERLIEEQERVLQEFLPELQEIYNGSSHSESIKFYRWKKAMYAAYSSLYDSLSATEDYLVFWDIQSWYETEPIFFQEWLKKRKKIVRTGKSIFTDSEMAQKFLTHQWNLETRVKVLHSKKKFRAIQLVTWKKIFLHKTGIPYLVIVIEDPSVVGLYKQMFEFLWEGI